MLASYFEGDYGTISHTARIRRAINFTGLTENTVRRIIWNFFDAGKLEIEDTSLRGAGALKYSRWRLPSDAREKVRAYVENCLDADDEPVWVYREGLQTFFRNEFGLDVSRQRISRLCAQWYITYGAIKKKPAGTCFVERLLLRQVYVSQLASAVNDDKTVFFVDESFANARSTPGFSYHLAGALYAMNIRAAWAHDCAGFICLARRAFASSMTLSMNPPFLRLAT